MTSRPKNLATVAKRTMEGSEFRLELADFLDEFYTEPSNAALIDAPLRMAGKVESGHRKDVYLAAVAEHLARQYHCRPGEWIFAEDLYLEKPAFAYQSRSGRIFLLKESPPAFKSRNLFVTANVLSRV